jgi:hypothetical protein
MHMPTEISAGLSRKIPLLHFFFFEKSCRFYLKHARLVFRCCEAKPKSEREASSSGVGRWEEWRHRRRAKSWTGISSSGILD